MLKLKHKSLSATAQARLTQLQASVDGETSHAAKVRKAQGLWDNKWGDKAAYPNNPGNVAFTEIKSTLKSMGQDEFDCPYCEHNKATDIEHIDPKSVFPEKAFVWENYLLACPQCNNTKLAKVWIFNPAESATAELATPGEAPASDDVAFLNPRKEDPMAFMELLLPDDYMFYPIPAACPLNSREWVKVEKTLEVLDLNDDKLTKKRAKAFQEYKRLIREYAQAKAATTHVQLEAALDGDPAVKHNLPFANEQHRILTHLLQSIQRSAHPTVFHEMIRKAAALPDSIQTNLAVILEDLTYSTM